MKCKMTTTLLSAEKSNHQAECPFCFRMVCLEVHFSETYLPDELLKQPFIPTTTSSTPTSRGDLFHPRKRSRCGHVPVFPHIHCGPGPLDPASMSHRESAMHARNYNGKLIRIRSGSVNPTGRPVLLFKLPFLYNVGPYQKVRWRKFKYLPQPYPVLT